MNKKILVLLAIILIAILAITVIAIKQKRAAQNPEITKQELQQKFQTLKTQYEQAKAQGYDVSETERLGKEAKTAFDKGEYKKVSTLLEQAAVLLKSFKTSDSTPTPASTPIPTTENVAWYKEGIIYETNAAYYKGGIKEMIKWVPHMKNVGVKTIYLLPIWSEKSYTPEDYYKINQRYGNEADLRNLVETIHKNDMKIVFDLVTGYSNANTNNFIYNNHPEWHIRDNKGTILWFYPDRWGPAIDRSNPEVIKYFTEVAKYYVKEYDIDGWRVDAPQNNYDPKIIEGDHSAVDIMRQVKNAIISVKPDAILLSEIPGPNSEENPAAEPLFDEMAEISYDWFLIGQTKGGMDTIPQDIKAALLRSKEALKQNADPDPEDVNLISNWANENYGIEVKSKNDVRKVQEKILQSEGKPSGFAANMIKGTATSAGLIDFFSKEKILYNRTRARWFENHDTHARAMMVYPNYWRNFVVLISTVPGVPFIHAGQETGETKADYISGKINESVSDFFKKVFLIRNSSNAIKYGDINDVWKSGDNVYAYSRTYENETVIVVINFNGKQAESILNIPFPNGTQLTDELNGETFTVSDSANFKITIPAYGSRILTN